MPRRDDPPLLLPQPYEPIDPERAGAWPPGSRPTGTPTVVQGRDNVTAAGEHIGTAPDLDLGPSGGGFVAPPIPPQEPGPRAETPVAAPQPRRRP